MDWSDPLFLARLQFGFVVSFHIIFPAFTIGVASFLAYTEGLWLWTGQQAYLTVFDFWKKIFAVAFGMGVVSGVVLCFFFGFFWCVFFVLVGFVFGPLMGYEVLTAYFLEAGFFGFLL